MKPQRPVYVEAENEVPAWCNDNTERDPLSLFSDDKSLIKREVKEELADQSNKVNVRSNDPSCHSEHGGANSTVATNSRAVLYSNTSPGVYEGNADNQAAILQSKRSEEGVPLCQDQACSELLPVARGFKNSTKLHPTQGLVESMGVGGAVMREELYSIPVETDTVIPTVKPIALFKNSTKLHPTEGLIELAGVGGAVMREEICIIPAETDTVIPTAKPVALFKNSSKLHPTQELIESVGIGGALMREEICSIPTETDTVTAKPVALFKDSTKLLVRERLMLKISTKLPPTEGLIESTYFGDTGMNKNLCSVSTVTDTVTPIAKHVAAFKNISIEPFKVIPIATTSRISTPKNISAQQVHNSSCLQNYIEVICLNSVGDKILAAAGVSSTKDTRSSSLDICSDSDNDDIQGEPLAAAAGVSSTKETRSRNLDADTVDLYWEMKKSKYVCKHCKNTYLDIDKCRIHIRSHLGLKPFTCTHENCKKGFASKDYLRRHVREFHAKHYRFQCKLCDRKFNRKCRLVEHSYRHKGQVVMPFDCDECGRGFSTKFSLRNHIVNIHLGNKTQHLCEKCGKVFKNFDGLKSHLRIHKEKRYKCKECNMRFVFPGKLAYHMASHSKERPFTCDICLKTYRVRESLSRHISLCHQEKKCFKCSKCDKSFVSGNFLKEHLLKHEGIRKYSCETCGKTFAQASHLGAHKFSHGEKKFVCSVCGAKFNRNDNMKSHVKRHETKS